MTHAAPLPAEIIKKARDMMAGGFKVTVIARELNVSPYRLRCELVPGFREHHAAGALIRKRAKRPKPSIVGAGHVEDRVPENDAAARLAEIPADTRSLTAFLMGDPLPGRRAIDLKARAAAGAPIPIVGDVPRADVKTGAGASQAFTPAPVAQSQVGQDGIHRLADRHPSKIAVVIHGPTIAH